MQLSVETDLNVARGTAQWYDLLDTLDQAVIETFGFNPEESDSLVEGKMLTSTFEAQYDSDPAAHCEVSIQSFVLCPECADRLEQTDEGYECSSCLLKI